MAHQGPPMAPGPPRPALAPGAPLGMQPGLNMASMTSMAPNLMGASGGSTLPIQPLNVVPGMPGSANGASRPSLAPGPPPGTQPLPISPLNMTSAGQPPAPHLGMSAAQVLNLNLLQGQPTPGFPQGLPQQPGQQQAGQQSAGLKRPAEGAPAPDGGAAAKRMRSGSEGDADAAGRPAGPAPGSLGPGGPAAAAAGPTAPTPPPQSTANLGMVHGTAGGGPNPTADLAALLLSANRANPYAAAYQQAAALQQAAAAQAAAAQAAAARRRAAAAAAAADPDDERRLLPRRGIRMALRAAGMDRDFVVDPATEAALLEFYIEWIGNAVALGCEVAKRRKSNVLKARDIAIHLERSWNLYIPGFNGEMLKPYRRPHASEVHRQRQLAVRRTSAELDHQQQHYQHQHHVGGSGGNAVQLAVSPGAGAGLAGGSGSGAPTG